MIGAARALLAAVFLTLAVGAGIGVAGAHSTVVGIDPETGSSLNAGPERVSVTFNEPLQSEFATLNVVGPDGNLWSKGDPTVSGPTVSTSVGELGPVGEYTIAYRVTSADGHPVSGTSTFTLTQEGTGTPGPKPGSAQSSGSESGGGSDSGGFPLWPIVAAAVVVFAGGLFLSLRKR